MKILPQITSKDMPLTPAIENRILKKIAKLERFYPRLISCRITIKIPNKHHHQGKIYNVRIDLKAPGKEIVVTKETGEDFYAALRDAFDAAKRRLEDFARLQRGDVKHHEMFSMPTASQDEDLRKNNA